MAYIKSNLNNCIAHIAKGPHSMWSLKKKIKTCFTQVKWIISHTQLQHVKHTKQNRRCTEMQCMLLLYVHNTL